MPAVRKIELCVYSRSLLGLDAWSSLIYSQPLRNFNFQNNTCNLDTADIIEKTFVNIYQ